MRHLITLRDVTAPEILQLYELAAQLKRDLRQGQRSPRLAQRVLGLLFSKPSLRTRVSFEAGMAQLGGTSLYLGQDVGWGTRETVADFARVISQYLDVLVCRTYAHQDVVELAKHCGCPVINGLTDLAHPCQALADLFTLRELKGDLAGQKIAFIGDGNNVARSLALACSKLQVQFAIASPRGYELDPAYVRQLEQDTPGFCIQQTDSPAKAVADATAVYTDVWASMGFEKEATKRQGDFAAFQVNGKLMAQAPPDAIFLHCLPAHRGQEVTDQVMDGPQSAVIQQAGNRMHVQKALLVWLLEQQ